MPDIVREHSQRRPLAATGLLEAVGFMGPLQVALHFIAIGADFRRSCLWDKSDAPSLYFCSGTDASRYCHPSGVEQTRQQTSTSPYSPLVQSCVCTRSASGTFHCHELQRTVPICFISSTPLDREIVQTSAFLQYPGLAHGTRQTHVERRSRRASA